MKFTRKLACLGFALLLAACQNIPTAVPTATATITPGGPTLTPSPTITPTPLPTLPPVVRIDSGDQALFYGDFDTARAQYQTAYNDSTDPALKAAALWGLGRTELADGNYQTALDYFNQLIADYADFNLFHARSLPDGTGLCRPRPAYPGGGCL